MLAKRELFSRIKLCDMWKEIQLPNIQISFWYCRQNKLWGFFGHKVDFMLPVTSQHIFLTRMAESGFYHKTRALKLNIVILSQTIMEIHPL
jgi:hypothetical protein